MPVETFSLAGPIRFGVFELDPRLGELRKNGMRVRLQAQAFVVLVALLERPFDLVTRAELQARLWPVDSFGDFEHGLNAAVRRLRQSLGDSAVTPRFVETLPRRGYRFIAPVDGVSIGSTARGSQFGRDMRARARWVVTCAVTAARFALPGGVF